MEPDWVPLPTLGDTLSRSRCRFEWLTKGEAPVRSACCRTCAACLVVIGKQTDSLELDGRPAETSSGFVLVWTATNAVLYWWTDSQDQKLHLDPLSAPSCRSLGLLCWAVPSAISTNLESKTRRRCPDSTFSNHSDGTRSPRATYHSMRICFMLPKG